MSDPGRPAAGVASERVAVVGGGFGGLSAACHLAAAGADVTMLEKNDRLGGVAGRIERDGYRIDTGPSWYLMPETFERFFGQFGREPADYYDLTRLDPNYRVFWKDGDTVDMPADRADQRALFDAYESGAGDALDDYLADAAEAYEIGMDRFVYPDRSRLRDMLDLDVARSARGLTLLGTMDEHVRDYFSHPKLRQLAEYALVFLGGSPYNTPALYTLMSHVDMDLGVYYPAGGISSVVDGLADLAADLGVEIETNAAVTAIDPSGGAGRRSSSGFDLSTTAGPRRADRVVANAAPTHVERDLLPAGAAGRDGYWESRTLAPSAFLLYLGVEGDVEPLAHHTLVLPTDWDPHFASIFEDPAWPDDPAYYVNAPSRTDPSIAPDGHSVVVVLVPIAPGLADDPDTRDQFRDMVLADLAEYAGVDLRGRIDLEERACVSEFADRINAPRGTALGLAHTLDQTGPLRPAHRAAGIDGLYYAGAYTNPGIGMPMCLISGRQAADAAAADAGGDGPLPSFPAVVPTSRWWPSP